MTKMIESGFPGSNCVAIDRRDLLEFSAIHKLQS